MCVCVCVCVCVKGYFHNITLIKKERKGFFFFFFAFLYSECVATTSTSMLNGQKNMLCRFFSHSGFRLWFSPFFFSSAFLNNWRKGHSANLSLMDDFYFHKTTLTF